MTESPLSSFIKDPKLRRLAEIHGLDLWHWGDDIDDVTALAMMEGAALLLRELYDEGRDIDLEIHRSGTMVVWGGAYFHYQIDPEHETKPDPSDDWEDDPVVKQYHVKNALTLSWDEGEQMDKEDKS
jgi:hypothetical protein